MGIAAARVELCQEASDVLALESAVTPQGDAVCVYSSVITPPPQGVGMDMEKPGYFPHRQHVIHLLFICHMFSYLFLD